MGIDYLLGRVFTLKRVRKTSTMGLGLPREKWTSNRIYPARKGKDISFIIWGAIWIGGRSDIVFMERDLEAPRCGYSAWSYLQVLKKQIPRIWSPGMKMQQDNASIHTARARYYDL